MSSATIAAFEDMQWLRRFAERLARDADDAQDLVQDTLVEAWRDPPVDAEHSLRPWLASVLRNRFRMARRGRERRERRETRAEDGREVTRPDDELARLEVLSILLGKLRELPSEDQTILVRRFFEGQTAAEIARSLGVPAATIRSRLHRSLKRLRTELDRSYGERKTWCAAVLSIPMGRVATPEASAASKSTMSITAKTIIASAMALGVGAYAYANADDEPVPASDSTPASTPAVTANAEPEPEPEPAADVPAKGSKVRWEARRTEIRSTIEVEPDTTGLAMVRPQRANAKYGELVRACMEDLESEAVGTLTMSIHEIGAPDIGTIYESVDVVHTDFDDEQTLECLVQSMYAYVGDAPEAPLDRVVTHKMTLGAARTFDQRSKQVVGYIVGAHVGDVRSCESMARGEVAGTVDYEITIGEGGVVEDSVPGPSQLPPAVLDCITTATKRWPFPKILDGQTFTHSFSLPIPAPDPSTRG